MPPASAPGDGTDNLEAIHGLSPGPFGGDFASFLENVDARSGTVMPKIQDAMARGGEYRVEYWLAGADAGERWVEGKGRVVLDPRGRLPAGGSSCWFGGSRADPGSSRPSRRPSALS
jgi:hypothetical protein